MQSISWPFRIVAVLVFAGLSMISCRGEESAPRPELGREAMKAQMSEAIRIPKLSPRFIAIGSLLEQLTAENAPGAGEAYAEDLILVRSCEMRPFASAWAEIDPETALDYAIGLKRIGSQRRREAISETVTAWAGQDRGKGAKAYLASLEPDSDDYRVVISNTIMGLAASGLASEATPLLASMPADDTREMLLFRVLLELVRSDAKQVRVWVDSIPVDAPNDLKATAFERAMALTIGLNPDYALDWFKANQFTDYANGKTIATLLKGLVEADPGTALTWLLELPNSADRDEAVREAAYLWLKAYPAEANEFLRENLHRSELRTAIFPYAQFMIKEDHVQAVEWALRVPVPFERARVLSQALVVWGHRDRPAVLKWLKEHREVDDPVLESVTDRLKIEPREIS